MENKELIICEKCYEENEITRNTCKYCGAKLYRNDNNKSSNSKNNIEDEEDINYDDENRNFNMTQNENNKMAMMLRVIAVIEIICGFILGGILGDTFGVGYYGYEFNWGLCIGIIVAGFINGIFILGFAEVIQLMQDIKLKIKK